MMQELLFSASTRTEALMGTVMGTACSLSEDPVILATPSASKVIPDRDGVSHVDEFFDSTNPDGSTSPQPHADCFSRSKTVALTKASYELGDATC